MRRFYLACVILLALTGCSHTPKEKAEERAKQEYFECKNDIETPTCKQQKNEEAREKDEHDLKEELREYERLRGE